MDKRLPSASANGALRPDQNASWLRRQFRITPISRRRWENFKANRRGHWSLCLFLTLFVVTLFAEVIANDKPIVASYKGEILFPVAIDYPEEKFGGFLAITDYKDPAIKEEIEANGWMLWPPIRYSFSSINNDYPRRKTAAGACLGFPSPPQWSRNGEFCDAPADQMQRFQAIGNRNWLGTDDQGRDVAARIIYGFRISVLFGLILTILASMNRHYNWGAPGILRRLDRPHRPAFPRDLVVDALSLHPHHHFVRSHSRFLDAVACDAGIFLDIPGRRRARRIPPWAQLRIHNSRPGAWLIKRDDHVQTPSPERHGRHFDVSTVPVDGSNYSIDGT